LTHAYTIDLVPLIFEKTCFAGHTSESKWKTNKTYQKAQKQKAYSRNVEEKHMEKPTYTLNLGMSTNVGGA
jgi:hypothetical protein